MPKELHKVTFGFITERWDATTKEFLGQEFTGEDTIYEDDRGEIVEDNLFDELTNPEPI